MIVLHEELSETQADISFTLIAIEYLIELLLVEVLFELFRLVSCGRLGLLAQASVLRIERFHALNLEEVEPL